MPIAPALPYIVGAGGSLIGGLLGNKKSKATNVAESTALANQTAAQQKQFSLADQLTSTARTLEPNASNFMSLASSSYSPVIDYWKGLLAPGTARATSILSPELSRISDSYSGAAQSARTLLPRGGGTASLMAAAPFQQARDVSTLFQTVRPQAAAGLLQSGQSAGNLATIGYEDVLRALTGASSAVGGAGAGATDALNTLFRKQALDFEQSKQMGSSIMSLLFGSQGATGPGGIIGLIQEALNKKKISPGGGINSSLGTDYRGGLDFLDEFRGGG